MTQPVSSTDGAWDDSDFYRRGGDVSRADDSDDVRHDAPQTPVLMVPGCASNAYTFDVAPGYSLARYLAEQGHDTWIAECRGVGFSRPWRKPAEWVDAKTGAPRQHTPPRRGAILTSTRTSAKTSRSPRGYVASVTGSRGARRRGTQHGWDAGHGARRRRRGPVSKRARVDGEGRAQAEPAEARASASKVKASSSASPSPSVRRRRLRARVAVVFGVAVVRSLVGVGR